MHNKLEQTLSDLIINKKEKFGTTLKNPIKLVNFNQLLGQL